jgi:AMP-polyphosphate phosphotransferase
MKTENFVVEGRPNLAAITSFPKMAPLTYERRMKELQVVLQLLQQAYLSGSERAVIVLEGWDTAGKGGIVRRLGWALDPRSFKVYPIGPPKGEEQGEHYLERFWRRLPTKSEIVAFDRSWYGRVLVERVEGFADRKDWRRAYREIREFEAMLVHAGMRLVKIFLHITPEEQERRFRQRLFDPLKRWKLSYEDFRNRAHWKEYETAIEDMMAETSAEQAPWYLIPSNDKAYSRIAAFRIVVERLGKSVPLQPRPVELAVLEEAKAVLGLTPGEIERALKPVKPKIKLPEH